jgi:hypothetical protein
MGTLYLWKDREKYQDCEMCKYVHDDNSSMDYLKFFQGERLSSENIDKTCVFTVGANSKVLRRYDCLVNDSFAPLVNKKVQSLLKKIAPNDVQFLPAIVRCADTIIQEYSILNITHLIHAIDHERSRYSILDLPDGFKMISTIKKLVLNCYSLAPYSIARDQELKYLQVVSEKIKYVFEEAGVTGVRFVEPEIYYTELYKMTYGRDPETGKRLSE